MISKTRLRNVSDRHNLKIILIPLLTSVVIETVQLFEGRRCDIDDVILNTAGAIIGWALFRICRYESKRRRQ